mmetsp:Transcript_23079/g.54484  ORF Transcript_23079/g.54484 Transcript_23079/m.54484 type:complete len:253 (-) Transcript_23079:648-1406(-)
MPVFLLCWVTVRQEWHSVLHVLWLLLLLLVSLFIGLVLQSVPQHRLACRRHDGCLVILKRRLAESTGQLWQKPTHDLTSSGAESNELIKTASVLIFEEREDVDGDVADTRVDEGMDVSRRHTADELGVSCGHRRECVIALLLQPVAASTHPQHAESTRQKTSAIVKHGGDASVGIVDIRRDKTTQSTHDGLFRSCRRACSELVASGSRVGVGVDSSLESSEQLAERFGESSWIPLCDGLAARIRRRHNLGAG